jgi:NAD-dependent deacetylase
MKANDSCPDRILSLVAAASRVAVITGAGMSAESGIPTFRGSHNGLWSRFDPEDLATPQAFCRDPALVWGWYRWRTGLVEQAAPNAGHRALATLEGRKPGLVIVTQNVDDLHERGGSTEVIHLHGSLFAPRCLDCAHPFLHEPVAQDLQQAPSLRLEPPVCGRCGGRIRPGVVWFGEALAADRLERAAEAMHRCDLLLVIGTSGIVHPAAGLPVLAKRKAAPIIEINPAPTALTGLADVSWRTTAAEGLAQIVAGI